MPTISEHDALPTGTRLGEFEILQVLGIGGFGIVYLAFDHALERQVAIKEYMPAALASRGSGAEVVVRSAAHAETFTLGMRSFINEARLLARFDHPSLVKVYRFWEQHGTAYMVMPYYKGRTLQQVRSDMSRPPDEAWLRRLITPLLGALECLHRENVFHRDVAPDNILLLDDESGPGRGQPVLLDLGAARRVIGGHTQTLTAIVKPSFAPIEQYAETVQLRQGPWSDLYALGAVVHYCITGRPPMPATVRAVHDDLATLRQMSASLASGFDCHFSASFAHAIDHALAVRPQDRPESIVAWRAELNGIVANPADVGDSVLEPKSLAWMAEAVLVRSDASEDAQPLRALAGEDIYMTTIPAASRLRAPPAWPPVHAPAGVPRPAVAAGAMDAPAAEPWRAAAANSAYAIPQTVPVARRPASAEPAGPDIDVGMLTAEGVDPGPAASSRGPDLHALEGASKAWASRQSPPWLRWSFAALLLMMCAALWWSQSRDKPEISADQDGAMQLTQTTSLAKVNGLGEGARKVDKGAASGQQQGADRPEGAARRADAGRPEAPVPLNPRRACGDRSFISLAICMKRHCSRPEYTAHSECARMRQQEADQRGNYYP